MTRITLTALLASALLSACEATDTTEPRRAPRRSPASFFLRGDRGAHAEDLPAAVEDAGE